MPINNTLKTALKAGSALGATSLAAIFAANAFLELHRPSSDHFAPTAPPPGEQKEFVLSSTPQDARTDYLYRTYSFTFWRYWDDIPQSYKDNFSYRYGSEIMWLDQFLDEAERNMQEAATEEAQMEAFERALNRYYDPENQDEVRHFFTAIQQYLQDTEIKREQEEAMIEEYLHNIHLRNQDVEVLATPALSTQQEIESFAENHQGSLTGTGIHWGEYGVAHSLQGEQILGTDFLMDCVAIVLVSVDENNPEDRYAVLAHIDATTNIERAVSRLMDEIPEHHRIDAQVLGSDRNENVYMNVEILDALVQSDRIASIAVNTHAATTVVVHAASGNILTVNDPEKGEHNSYQIDTLPVEVNFVDREPFRSYRSASYAQLRRLTPNSTFIPSSQIVRRAHPYLPLEDHAAADTTIDRLIEQDGFIDLEDLKILAEDIQTNMHTPDGVCVYFNVWEGGTITLNADFNIESDFRQIKFLGSRHFREEPNFQYGTLCDLN